MDIIQELKEKAEELLNQEKKHKQLLYKLLSSKPEKQGSGDVDCGVHGGEKRDDEIKRLEEKIKELESKRIAIEIELNQLLEQLNEVKTEQDEVQELILELLNAE